MLPFKITKMWSTQARNTFSFMIVASNFFVAVFCPFSYHSNESNNITDNKKIDSVTLKGSARMKGVVMKYCGAL